MKSALIACWIPLVALGAMAAMAACSSDESGSAGGAGSPGAQPDAAVEADAAGGQDAGGFGVEVACNDSLDSVYGDPGALPADKGAILRCAKEQDVSRTAMQARIDAAGYKSKPLASGARVYRVLYRTERGNGAPGASSAMVYLPDTPLADKLPVLVVSHGSRGQAATCAPSKNTPEGAYVQTDFETLVLGLAGAGFAVIAPDLAGYANFGAPGNPPSVFASAPDVARSTLDGARALRKLAGSKLTDQVVLAGHSQGGHTTLSALAFADSYGAGLSIAAAAVYAPLWLSQRSWGALLLVASQYKIADSPAVNATSIWYHYTQAELYDGPGKGQELFQSGKRDAIRKWVEETCWSKSYPALEALGSTAADLFDTELQDAVKLAAAMTGTCPTDEPKKSVCEKWMKRYLDDRPHLLGSAATVPILVAYGGMDTTIAPDRFQCAIDRLVADKASLSYCFDPAADHSGVVATQGGFVAEWIANKTLGKPIAASCPASAITLVADGGATVKCNPVPPND
jgi:alpha-beta hydrolase superfamily lysophospholipase